MSSLFSRRDRVDVPPVRAPREGGRTRMAGERPSRTRRRRRSEERQRSIEEAFEKRRRGRRSRRGGEEERSRSRSRGLVGGRRKNPKPPKDKGSEVVLDTFMGTGGRRSDPRREKVYHPIVKSKTPKDQRPVKEDRGTVNTTGRMVDPKPPTGGRGGRTGGRRSDPRPDRDRGRGGRRGRRRVRDEAFERRRRGGSPRRISREERRRRVRVANTRK